MEWEKTPEKRKLWFLSRKINWILFGISILIGITGLIFRSAPGWHNPFRTLGEYLSLSFLLSLGLIAVIGFQRKTRNNFLKALFHAYLLAICMVAASSIILPVFTFNGWNISDVFFCLYVSIPTFVIFEGSSLSASLIVISSWLLFLLLLGLSLWGIRTIKMKMFRIGGQILAILVFAGVYYLCHYQIAKAISSVMALGVY